MQPRHQAKKGHSGGRRRKRGIREEEKKETRKVSEEGKSLLTAGKIDFGEILIKRCSRRFRHAEYAG